MTELTDEAVTKLANDCVLAANCMEAEDTFPTGQGILREAARALLDARAENARLRADAQAAEALALQQAAGIVRSVWGRCEALEDEAADKLANPEKLTEHEQGFWRGQKMVAKSIRRSIEMPLAPADGLAAVEALQRDVHSLVAAICDSWDERDRLAAELDAAQQREAGLLGLIRWAHETLWELNPNNYDHDEVCKVNDAAVEVILGLAPVIGETHGYSAEWWAERAALSNNGRGE